MQGSSWSCASGASYAAVYTRLDNSCGLSAGHGTCPLDEASVMREVPDLEAGLDVGLAFAGRAWRKPKVATTSHCADDQLVCRPGWLFAYGLAV